MLLKIATFWYFSISCSRLILSGFSAKSENDSSTISMQSWGSSVFTSRMRSGLGINIDVGLLGVTTTATSAFTLIASAANLSTSNWNDGNSSGNSITWPEGAALAYSLKEGTGTINLPDMCPDTIFINSAAPLPTTILSAGWSISLPISPARASCAIG